MELLKIGTLLDMSSICEPTSQRDGGDLEPGAAKEPVLHLGETFGNRHLSGQRCDLHCEYRNCLSFYFRKWGALG